MFFKLSWPKGRSENPEGVGQVVIQGPLKEEVFRLFLKKSWDFLPPLPPPYSNVPGCPYISSITDPFVKSFHEREERKRASLSFGGF